MTDTADLATYEPSLPGMSDDPVPIQVALSRVMAEVQSVGKTGWNEGQKFNFRGIDETVDAVGPAFRKHGVIPLPDVISERSEDYSTKGGTVMHRVLLHVRFTFVGPAGDTLSCSTMGESADSGDKATSKAHSVAYRTALLEALCIPTQAPDPDAESHERVMEAPLPPIAVGLGWQSTEEQSEHFDGLRSATTSLPDDASAPIIAWVKDVGIKRSSLTPRLAQVWADRIASAAATSPVEDAGDVAVGETVGAGTEPF